MKMSKLEMEVMEAATAYYAGKPVLEDSAFDRLQEKLREENPESPVLKMVGAPVAGKVKVPHAMLMGSLNKVTDEESFLAWSRKYAGSKIIQPKYDGLSIGLTYDSGTFVRAATRGDGAVGEDVTRNVAAGIQAQKLPLHLPNVGRGIITIRAEAYIPLSEYKKSAFSEFKNPRNAAAGIIGSSKTKLAAYLSYSCYDIHGLDFETEVDLLSWLVKAGLPNAQWEIKSTGTKCWDWWKNSGEKFRDSLDFEIDGIVVKLNDRTKALEEGHKDNRPLAQIAIKYPSKGEETTLRKVTYSLGHTGTVCPIGWFDKVNIGGADYDHATLCNADEIGRLDIAIGDTILVQRMNDIIPKISSRIEKGQDRKPILFCEECPICGQALIRKGANTLCKNPECAGQAVGKMKNWCRKRNILGLGDAIIEAVFDAGFRKIRSLYTMRGMDWETLELPQEDGSVRILGSKMAVKIMEEIEKSREVELGDFLGCVGCPTLGRSLAEPLILALNIGSVEEFLGLSQRLIAGVDNFGELRAREIVSWFSRNHDDVLELASEMKFKRKEVVKMATGGKLSGMSFVFTGKASMPRSELHRLVSENGGIPSDSVTKTTTYLVAELTDSNKAQKARKYGTKVINESEFLKMVGQ